MGSDRPQATCRLASGSRGRHRRTSGDLLPDQQDQRAQRPEEEGRHREADGDVRERAQRPTADVHDLDAAAIRERAKGNVPIGSRPVVDDLIRPGRLEPAR